jgi:hypothetical protein
VSLGRGEVAVTMFCRAWYAIEFDEGNRSWVARRADKEESVKILGG